MKNYLALTIGIIAVISIPVLGTAPTSDHERTFGPPNRGNDLTMDMNISEASLASFLGEPYSASAFSIAGAGDVNRDGFNDILIGAHNDDEGGSNSGQTYLILGRATGWSYDILLSNVDASFIGEGAEDRSGYSVSGVGDVNGDGFHDILIGALNNDEDRLNAGQTYLILGKGSGWSLDTPLSSADASFIGEAADDFSGGSVSGASDVNGDGLDDFLIGAYGNDEGGTNSGQTYLILGKKTGWSRDVPLSNANASFIGEVSSDSAGISVSEAGDVNRDGFDDVLIGAYLNDEAGSNAGQTYLIFGKETGWSMDTDLSMADASFWGEEADDVSGKSISGAGDVNGDGYDDMLIGAWANDEGGNTAGQTYLILGKGTGWSMDTDLSTADASYIGETASDYAGESISGAGDVNGDGFSDFLIGSRLNGEVNSDAGQTYLIFGRSDGWSMDTDLGLSDASFLGEDEGDRSGNTVAGVGDVEGNGSDDILIGASEDEEGGTGAGQTYLITGSFYPEPLAIHDIKVRNGFGDEIRRADIGEIVHIEMTGNDSNVTHIDRARVNASFSESIPSQLTVSLVETGVNTGIYQGAFMVPFRSKYFERMRFSAYIDQTKMHDVIVDYPFRPSSVQSIGIYDGPSSSTTLDKLDFGQPALFKCVGSDSNPSSVDKSFVNLTSDKNSSFGPMLVMIETGQATGIYVTQFTVPDSMDYFENITLRSGEDPSVAARFMVHTPVQIRARGPVQTALEDLEYRASFYNFGYNPVTWTVETNASWLSWDDVELELHGTPGNGEAGEHLWEVQMEVRDAFGNSNGTDFRITVINTPPMITTVPLVECFEKEGYALDVNCTDDGEGDVNYYLNTNSPFLSIEKETGVVSGTPIEGDEGIYLVNVQVQDGNGGSDFLEFNLTVIGTNDRPTITTTDIRQIEQDTPFTRDYDVFDPDESDTHIWTMRTDAEWLDMEIGTGVLFGTPDCYDIGDWLVNITVTDAGGLNDSREFTLKVLNKNDKPIWTDVPADIELVHGTEYYFEANATDLDSDTTLVFSIGSEPDTDVIVNSRTGEIGWTANYRSMPQSGGILVKLTVSDGELFIMHEFTITVTPTESPKVEITSPKKGARTPSTGTELEWVGTDPENEPLSYTLYLADSESYVMAKREDDIREKDIIENNYTLTGLTQGKTYYWTVVPDDGCTSGRCTNGVFSFRVNSRPVLEEVLAQSAEAGKEFNYKLEGSDGDQDDDLTYEVLSGPDGLTVRAETGMIVWTPKDDQVGTHKVRVKVTDGYEFVELPFDIKVEEGGRSDIGLVIVIVVVALVMIVALLLIYILIIKGKSKREDEEDEETKKLQEVIEQKRREREWEEAHTRESDHTVLSDVPISAVDAHAHDHDGKPKSYEELYGTKMPEDGEE